MITNEAPKTYMDSFREVRNFLAQKNLDSLIFKVVDEGYDDLEAISRSNEMEMEEFVSIFSDPDHQNEIRILVRVLRAIGIEQYRAGAMRASFNEEEDKSEDQEEDNEFNISREIYTKPEKEIFRSSTGTLPTLRPLQAAALSARRFVNWDELDQNLSGYLTLTYEKLYGEEPCDKWFTLTCSLLVWKSSKKSPTPEGSIDCSSADWAIQNVDTKTIMFINDSSKTELSLEFEDKDMLDEWFPVDAKMANAAVPKSLVQYSSEGALSAYTNTHKASVTVGGVVAMLEDPKNRKSVDILLNGAVFKKYKKNSATKRIIFASDDLSKLAWSDVKSQRDIQGFISTREIQQIEPGFGKNKLKIYIVTSSSVIEIEAIDITMFNEWLRALKFLIEFVKCEVQEESKLLKYVDSSNAYQELVDSTKVALKAGEVFRKIGSNNVAAIRHVYCMDDMQNLVWEDIETGKVKGHIPMEDIFQISNEKSKDNNKLIILAKKQMLVLEAKDSVVKENFMEAMNFWVKNLCLSNSLL